MSGRTFDDVAQRYDFLNDLFSLFLHRAWRRKITADLSGSAGLFVLDVCTGTADSAIPFLRRLASSRVIGVDICEPMLAKALAKTRDKEWGGRLWLCRADALTMPFAADRFDAVINAFGLRNEASFPSAIREMARVLKPGGALRILEFGLPENRLWRRGYLFYLARVMPAVGHLLGAPRDAYEYLSRTIRDFITPDKVVGLMRESGLTDVRSRGLCGGVAYVYRGRKTVLKKTAGET